MGIAILFLFGLPAILASMITPDNVGVGYIIFFIIEVVAIGWIAATHPDGFDSVSTSQPQPKKQTKRNPMVPHMYRKSIRRFVKRF